MRFTQTFEPIRPLHGKWTLTECYKLIFAGYRVFYGWPEWPSYSYTTFGLDKED